MQPAEPTPIVVVCGPPASGKTTLARAIADDLRLPLLSKDALKEVLFDALGSGDRAWSLRLGLATYPVLVHLLAEQLRARRPVVVETINGDAAESAFRELRAQAPYRALQILLSGDPDVLATRWEGRAAARHAGHAEALAETRADVRIALEGARRALDLGGELLTVDTTDFTRVDVGELLSAARRHVSV